APADRRGGASGTAAQTVIKAEWLLGRMTMRELDVNGLRALIKLIAPLRALREDVEKSLHLEMYSSAGDLAVRSLEALHEQILDITQDRYVAALTVDAGRGGDREKFSQVLLVSGQLLAYLEAQTGVNVAT